MYMNVILEDQNANESTLTKYSKVKAEVSVKKSNPNNIYGIHIVRVLGVEPPPPNKNAPIGNTHQITSNTLEQFILTHRAARVQAQMLDKAIRAAQAHRQQQHQQQQTPRSPHPPPASSSKCHYAKNTYEFEQKIRKISESVALNMTEAIADAFSRTIEPVRATLQSAIVVPSSSGSQ